MNIVNLKVNDLIPYINNPRENDNAVDAVAKSIQEFGFQQPLVLDKDYVIIVGHTRLKASKKLGLETVPCIIADNLTEEQVKAYRLADNKVGELSKWDLELLNIELGEIEMDMTDFGFIELADLDVDGFFEESQPKEKNEEPKEIQCPHCKMFFEVE